MQETVGTPKIAPPITAAIISALSSAGSVALDAAKKKVNDARYWMVGEVANTTPFDLKREHSHAHHGEWEKTPPLYIRGYDQLGKNYLALAESLFQGITSLEQLSEGQVKTLLETAKKENSGPTDEDEVNYGILPMESTGAGVEGIVVYDVVGYALYVCFLLDNPQGLSSKKAGCSIMSKSFFDRKKYQDDLDDLIDHMFDVSPTGHTEVKDDGESGSVTHGVNGGTLKVSWSVAHETKFEVEFE